LPASCARCAGGDCGGAACAEIANSAESAKILSGAFNQCPL
jgi:hypothetical protein